MLLRTVLRSVAATSLLAAAVVALAPAAGAAAAMSATSGYNGATAQVATPLETTITIKNLSTAPDSALTIEHIYFVPACGSTGPITNDCPADFADPAIFAVQPTAMGVDGTTCQDTTFLVVAVDNSSSQFELTPSRQVVLGGPAPDLDVCQILLRLTPRSMPTKDSRPGLAGLQTDGYAVAHGVVASGVEATATGGSFLTITPATPSLVTQVVDSDVAAGDDVADAATLSGGAEPTGTLTFDLFGPDDDDCSGAPVASSTHPVTGAGTYPSTAVTPSGPGAYRFVARYSGDADNAPVSGSCNDPNEAVAVSAAEPPGIRVLKVATPLSRPEPGGTFSFHVAVTNTSAVPLTLTGIADDVHGDVATQGTCTDAVGTDLAPGDSYECDFPGQVTGNAGTTQTDVVTVTAVDDGGTTVTDDDDAVVSLTDVPPSVTVAKDALPDTRVAPGGVVTFGVRITSTSVEPVTITALTDDVYGDLARQTGSTCAQLVGTVLQPAEAATCTFEGAFTGEAGAAQTDVVIVTVTDDEGSTGTAQDDATVRLVAPGEVPSSTSTTATARPTSPVATARPPRLASTGSDPRRSGLLAGALVGVGLLCLGLGSLTERRERT